MTGAFDPVAWGEDHGFWRAHRGVATGDVPPRLRPWPPPEWSSTWRCDGAGLGQAW